MANRIGGAPNVSNLLTTANTIREESGILPTEKKSFLTRLNEGLDSGLRVLSPDFRQVREQQDILELERKEEERSEKVFQLQNRFIAFDDALGTTTPSQRKFIEDRARRLGIVIEEDGREGTRVGEGSKALQEMQDEPQEIIALNNLGILDHRKSLASLKEVEKKEIDKMMNSAMKENPNASPLETRERIMKASRDPANQSDALRQLNADRQFLNGKILILRNENVSLSEPLSEIKQPVKIQEFETITGIDQSLRGTPGYESAFFDFQEKVKEKTQGRKQLVGTTPEGQIVVFDSVSGAIETHDIISEILPKNKKLVSGEVATQLAVFDSLINQIDDIKILAEKNPQFIGPLQGQWSKLKSRFTDNPDFTELDRNIESLITIAYALSGKQISADELRMLKSAILPTVTQPGANFNVALDFASKWLTSNRDSRIKRLRETGFFVGGEKEPKMTTTRQPKTETDKTTKDKDVQAVDAFINKKRK